MESTLRQIATRVALYDDIAEDIEPNYSKILNVLNLQVRNTLKDLIEAVKDKDETMTLHVLNILMGQLEEIYKYMGMRQFKQKLKTLVENQFPDIK